MLNLKLALVFFGAIHMVQGIVLIIAPDRVARLSNFGELTGYEPYFMAILGSAFIAAAVWFITSGLDPLKNISGVKFAILWAGLLLVIQLFTLRPIYGISISQIWLGVVINAIFAVAFLVFYPYRQR